MFKGFPRIEIPSGLHIDQKKVLIFLLVYEAGFYELQPGFHRNRILVQLGKQFPNLVTESAEHMLLLKDFNDEMNKMPAEIAAKAYTKFVGIAKSTKLWNILKPKSKEVLAEVQRVLFDNSAITEVDWLQILFELKITTESEQAYYRSLVLENGYQIVQSIAALDEIALEFDNTDDGDKIPNEEMIRLFYELVDENNSEERKKEIRDRLFHVNKRLVPFVLEKMKSHANYTPARDRDDDLQEGFTALWLAIEKFDVKKGHQFSTYAVQCIRGNILRFRNRNRFLQHVPENQNLSYQKAVKTKNRAEAELGREITIQEWAKLMNMPEYKLTKLLDIHQETVYFGFPVHSSSEDLLLEEIISDATNVEDEIVEMALTEKLSDVLGRLEQREEDILRLRCGFYHTPQELLHAQMKLGRVVHPNEPVTFEEIAKAYGITRERVRQILDNAYRTLRHPSIQRQFHDFREDIEDHA